MAGCQTEHPSLACVATGGHGASKTKRGFASPAEEQGRGGQAGGGGGEGGGGGLCEARAPRLTIRRVDLSVCVLRWGGYAPHETQPNTSRLRGQCRLVEVAKLRILCTRNCHVQPEHERAHAYAFAKSADSKRLILISVTTACFIAVDAARDGEKTGKRKRGAPRRWSWCVRLHVCCVSVCVLVYVDCKSERTPRARVCARKRVYL